MLIAPAPACSLAVMQAGARAWRQSPRRRAGHAEPGCTGNRTLDSTSTAAQAALVRTWLDGRPDEPVPARPLIRAAFGLPLGVIPPGPDVAMVIHRDLPPWPRGS